jgi:hypothetical protein
MTDHASPETVKQTCGFSIAARIFCEGAHSAGAEVAAAWIYWFGEGVRGPLANRTSCSKDTTLPASTTVPPRP